MKTPLLESLYKKYNIANLKSGAIHDKLGDVYEEYCVTILNNKEYLGTLQKGIHNTLELEVLYRILVCNNLSDFDSISSISATNIIPHRITGGNSKTDIIATVNMTDGNKLTLPISCKQSTRNKVSLAEFDVDTICTEMCITNPRLKELLLKHQTDCSAKNFTSKEKAELTTLMAPIGRNFVRWVLSGSPNTGVDDVCIPTSIIKFKLKKPACQNINVSAGDFDYVSFDMLSIEDCIDRIMYNSKGTLKKSGFNTGLSWTYATGSKGQKMQFKG